jgi:NhaA family Na+:H+ antiporter
MATDIAFAVGILALLGQRASAGAKLFLLSVAIVDDIIAIAIIALFYAEPISLGWLAAAGALLVASALAARRAAGLLLPLGLALWWALHESGVHAPLAGVVLGLLLPVAVGERVEHRLHPYSAFVVVPLFAVANAGLDFSVLGDAVGSTLTLAVFAGLVVGKLLGIAGAALLALRAGWGTLPAGVERSHLIGLAALGGIGFTVSIFIADLAFDQAELYNEAKVGIFAGSIVSGVVGATLLARRGAR